MSPDVYMDYISWCTHRLCLPMYTWIISPDVHIDYVSRCIHVCKKSDPDVSAGLPVPNESFLWKLRPIRERRQRATLWTQCVTGLWSERDVLLGYGLNVVCYWVMVRTWCMCYWVIYIIHPLTAWLLECCHCQAVRGYILNTVRRGRFLVWKKTSSSHSISAPIPSSGYSHCVCVCARARARLQIIIVHAVCVCVPYNTLCKLFW